MSQDTTKPVKLVAIACRITPGEAGVLSLMLYQSANNNFQYSGIDYNPAFSMRVLILLDAIASLYPSYSLIPFLIYSHPWSVIPAAWSRSA